MTQKKTDNRRIVSGRNIYIDDKGQAVLYDKKTKIGDVIKESDAESYRLYQNRIAISIAVFMLLTSFLNDWKLPLIAGVILAGILAVASLFGFLFLEGGFALNMAFVAVFSFSFSQVKA